MVSGRLSATKSDDFPTCWLPCGGRSGISRLLHSTVAGVDRNTFLRGKFTNLSDITRDNERLVKFLTLVDHIFHNQLGCGDRPHPPFGGTDYRLSFGHCRLLRQSGNQKSLMKIEGLLLQPLYFFYYSIFINSIVSH